jgi:lipoic acid synthetase
MQTSIHHSLPLRKPDWLKREIPTSNNYFALETELAKRGLYTVCQEASCPNIAECWAAKTATMMILGDTCTRACKFCHVKTGNPKGIINREEVEQAAAMVGTMGLKYIVITSVDRDDLWDHGASHFANVVRRIRQVHPHTKVEVLIPDFDGVEQYMHILAQSHPFVIAQNLETVERLTHPVRDRRAGYQKTLSVLKFYKNYYPEIKTKSSLMVGLGETREELSQAMSDLRKAGVDLITFGQYLRPSKNHLEVKRYYSPVEFELLKNEALERGFEFVASGPMVRSSYKAADYLTFLEGQGHEVR